MKIFKKNVLLKIFSSSLITLPTPSNISFWWNFGSLLGLCLMTQIFTGFFLSMHYCSNIDLAFESIVHINRNVQNGWLYRLIHSNGASMFFICLYLHIGRNIYYESYYFIHTWSVGIVIFLLCMGSAFLGYVLPWGQMSFWGATVITNLMSAIPYVGSDLVQWIWGGFAINNVTLNRFFSLHFILPLVLSMFVMIHIFYLHQTGSNNPLSLKKSLDKIPFNPYFTIKDLLGMLIFFMFFLYMSLNHPFFLMDPDNFQLANPLSTPPHIQPEWYFLFAYSILRSIPSKLGGVIALLMSILILFIMPFLKKKYIQSNTFYYMNKIWFWMFFSNFLILTWIGSKSIDYPFVNIGQLMTITYFSFYLIIPFLNKTWNSLIN
uniref:cytochrome b n=1 Tax=Cheumatopsyche brevilineata TaxID=1437087 RepID=UPI002237EE5C|nr:cytochrome b [Cheumatopsyche brevilineata]UYO79212.1 cytochrome b [Cheumatopsyche brevilineata]